MSRRIAWTAKAWEDYLFWQGTDKAILRKINELVKSAARTPHEGPGKPEPLKFGLSGAWSRRINAEHRLVYHLDGETLVIAACRYHY
jgi:toxin YoeB